MNLSRLWAAGIAACLVQGCGEPTLKPQPALLNLSTPLHYPLSYPLSAAQVQLQQQRIQLLRQQVQQHHQRQQQGVESLSDSLALEEQLALLEVSIAADAAQQRQLLTYLAERYHKVMVEQQAKVDLGILHPDQLTLTHSRYLELKMLLLQLPEPSVLGFDEPSEV